MTLNNGILFTTTGPRTETITDAIDASDSQITNAINVGDNVILGTTTTIDFTSFDVASGGDLTMTQTSPSIFLIDTNVGSDDFELRNDLNFFGIVNTTDTRTDFAILGSGNISIGDNSTAKTIDIAAGSATGADTINIGTGGTSADTI